MLQTIRDRAQGWIAWVIVILISIPFALWGIQSYLGVGGEVIVAKVNGVEIKEQDLQRRLQQARIQLRERLGAAYDAAQIDDRRLRQDVLDEMIRETLLVDVSDRLGFRVSDRELQAQILSEPAFQRGGQFDKTVYEQVLSYQGLSPAMFEAQARQRMIGTQLVRGIVGSELITKAEREALQRLSGQRRELSWLRIPAARFVDDTPIPEDEIQAFYRVNTARFQTPEQVRLEYVVLDVDALATGSVVSEEELRRLYESEQARFGQPERRNVRHILLPLPGDADDAKAKSVLEEIQALRDRVQAGEDFGELAKAVSKDPGSASQGGSLGEIEQGMMDPTFDQAAFALAAAGELSEPVRSRFGYHLIKVDAIIPAHIKPFEEVRESLRAELARQKAEALYYDLGERLASVVYEHPDSLTPAAEELGLAVQQSDWIGRSGGEGLLGHPKVTAAAFSEEVLGERRNSDLIEPEKDGLQAVVLRVIDHREASTRPLDEVREEIIATLRQERARKAAMASAEAAAEKLRGGADWAELGGETPEELGLVGRNDAKMPVSIQTVAFTLPAPAEGRPSLGTAVLEDGDAAIVRVTRLEPGETTPGESGSGDQERSMLTQLLGRHASDAVLEDMEQRAKIERKPLGEVSEG